MDECEALRAVDVSSLNERECRFLLDVLRALMAGPAPLPSVARRTAASSYGEAERRLRFLESQGLVGHKSSIKSGHLVPEFHIEDRGRRAIELAEVRGAARTTAPPKSK